MPPSQPPFSLRIAQIANGLIERPAGPDTVREIGDLARGAHERLELALRSSGYGVWEMDAATRRVEFDDRMHEIYGLERGTFSGDELDLAAFLHADDRASVADLRRRALNGEIESYDVTFRIIRSDGVIRTLEAHGQVARDEAGSPTRLVGMDRDISADQAMREALRLAEERLELALGAANESVWDWDIPSGQIYRDRRWTQMIGLPGDQIRGDLSEWTERVHPDDLGATRLALDRHLDGRTPIFVSEHRLRTGKGEWIWTMDRGKVVSRDKQGRPLRMVGTQSDITERKLLEQRLRHSEEISIQLSRLAQIGAWEHILATEQTIWAPELYSLCEVELGYVPGLDRMAGFFPDVQGEQFREAIAQAVVDGHPFDMEAPLTTMRGRTRWVRVIGQAEFRDGRAVRIFGALQDITAQREAEQSQRKLESQLFQVQKMETLGTLTGGIAHDFNNLLTGIMGYQDLALETMAEGDPSRDLLAEARNASLRARDLVDQILTFSRQSRGGEKTPTDLAVVIEEVRRFLRATVPATIQIDVSIADGCSPVMGDAAQLHQLLLNLATNATHAMRATGGVLTMSLAPEEFDAMRAATNGNLPPGAYVRLSVIDSGHGIDPEIQKRIFDPFFTTKGVKEGTGLGLAVVHGVAKSHGGAIEVESTPGKGTRFDVFLPAAGGAERKVETGTVSPARGRGETICIVDDEHFVAHVMRIGLQNFGYRTMVFGDPVACLDALKRDPRSCDLLLTDQTMPGMTGMKLAAEVRGLSPSMPILIMSGYFSKVSTKSLEEIGNISLIAKPFTVLELAVQVERCLKGG